MASAKVQNESPSSGMSLSRNSPVNDSAGNPPPAGSLTPGVVKRKLIVDTNKRMESRLPAIDSLGATGLMASRMAAVSSTTPSSAENV